MNEWSYGLCQGGRSGPGRLGPPRRGEGRETVLPSNGEAVVEQRTECMYCVCTSWCQSKFSETSLRSIHAGTGYPARENIENSDDNARSKSTDKCLPSAVGELRLQVRKWMGFKLHGRECHQAGASSSEFQHDYLTYRPRIYQSQCKVITNVHAYRENGERQQKQKDWWYKTLDYAHLISTAKTPKVRPLKNQTQPVVIDMDGTCKHLKEKQRKLLGIHHH